jgi:hypothetical protein
LTILATLVVKCPLLTRVRIIQEEIWETDQSLTISAFVRGLTSIKSLEVDHLDQAAFEHLSYLPHLATLTLGMPNFSRADGPASSAKPKFAALRELILNSARSQTVLACVRALSSCALESFNVVITPPPDTSSTMQIYVAVKKYLPSATLKTLRITSTRISAQQTFPIEPPAITVKTIKYLFRFNNLTFLSLSPPTGTDVDDDAVLSMAEAFPRLEHLSLSSRAKAHPLRATLRSLRYLAQHCPYLSYLEMSLNASDVPDIEYNVRSRIFNSSLEEWDVAGSLIKSPFLVARFLSGIFPELTQISTSMQDKWVYDDGVADVLRNLWGEVAEALPICGDMREEERHWIMQDDCSCTYRQDSESDDGSVEL